MLSKCGERSISASALVSTIYIPLELCVGRWVRSLGAVVSIVSVQPSKCFKRANNQRVPDVTNIQAARGKVQPGTREKAYHISKRVRVDK